MFKVRNFLIFSLLFYKFLSYADPFPFDPPKNFVLDPNDIAIHHPVTTNQILAQLYFDQGLTFVYAFNHDAAYWSFLRASQIDPNLAMSYWGMALSLGPNINMEMTADRGRRAYDIIEMAKQKVSNVSENEKDYIAALATRYSANESNRADLNKNYSQAMKKLHEKYPDDPDAAVLYAESILDVNPWNQWTSDGKPNEGTLEVIQILQGVLRRKPDHLGANHFYIHAVEASPNPEMALMSAERLRSLLPSSGHILHMPSHIYLLIGDYAQAVSTNLNAIVADRIYIRNYGLEGIYPLHYLSHNFYFLSRAFTLQGRFVDAKHVADELTEFYVPHFKTMPGVEYYASAPLTVLLNFRKWEEILDLPKPDENMKVTIAVWHYGRALAFAMIKRMDLALNEQKEFERRKNEINASMIFGYNRASEILNIAKDTLDAAIAEIQLNTDQAIKSLLHAIEIQDQLRYNEPPDWFYPTRIALGGLYLRLKKPKEAEGMFREELKRHPRNGRALFGLKESLKNQNLLTDSEWVNGEFQEAWKYSGIQLNIHDL